MYLGREYDNLLTVDLICHGVPPAAYLKEHLAHIDPKCRATRLTFRGEGWFFLSLWEGDTAFYHRVSGVDEYYDAFMKGLTYRENCYQCPYANPKRVADITLGDFWGVDRTSLQPAYDGDISVVLLNTPAGKTAFEEIAPALGRQQRPLEEPLAENAQLTHPTPRNPDRDLFLKHYPSLGFLGAMRKTRVYKNNRLGYAKEWFKATALGSWIKKLIKRRRAGA